MQVYHKQGLALHENKWQIINPATQTILYGSYKGSTLSDVPTEYIAYLERELAPVMTPAELGVILTALLGRRRAEVIA